MTARLEKVTSWLKENNHSFAFIQSPSNVFYLTNFQCVPHERVFGLIVFPHAEPFLVCPNMEVGPARAAGWDGEIISYHDSDDVWAFITNAVHAKVKEVETIVIEKEVMSYSYCEKLLASFVNAKFVGGDQILHTLRMIKDEKEIAILREAAKLADYGIEIAVSEVGEGKTETDIIATVEYELKKKGIQKMSFSTLVLFGEKTADPHGNPGMRKIKPGDFVLFDLGVVLDGYCSDITRTFVYKKASEKQKEMYETVLQAQELSLSISKAGTRLGDIDKIARDHIASKGYGEYFIHRIGHGLGIDVHEYPSLSGNNDNYLQKGMVYTIEPGIYVPEIGGVRIEDDVIITETGQECLTSYPKNFQVIG